MRFARLICLILIVAAAASCSKSRSPSAGVISIAGVKNGNGCIDSTYKCTEKPGLYQGQMFAVVQDFNIKYGGGNDSYFTDGKEIELAELLKLEGHEYCGLTIATDSKDQAIVPNALIESPGVAKVPKAIVLKLDNISWYVETVFFTGVYAGQNLSLSADCGKIEKGQLNSSAEETSLASITKSLSPYLKLSPLR